MTKREEFIVTLRAVAHDLQRYAAQIQDTGRIDLMGEIEPPPTFVSYEVQALIYKDITGED